MRIVCLYSGGLDSTTLLWHLRNQGHEVLPVSFNYNQRHAVELQVAAENANPFGGTKVIDLTSLGILLKGSSQTDLSVPVPEGHYAEESMKLTVVPNRNMVLLACAGAYAVAEKADGIAFANHAGDHTIYPDCRLEFVTAMAQAFQLCDWHQVKLLAPFTRWSKTQVAREASRLGVPLSSTWSCYNPQPIPAAKLNRAKDSSALPPWSATHLGLQHCGKCGTCTERIEAMHEAAVLDTTWYATDL